MTLYIDIENKKLVQSLTSDRTVATPIFMQGDNEPLILHLLEKGDDTLYKEKALVLGTDFLRVAIARFSGYPKSLTYASRYTLNSDGAVEIILPLNTTAIENAVQDNESISAFLEVEYSNTSGRIVTVLQTACRLKNDLIDNAPSIDLQDQFYDKVYTDEIFSKKSANLSDLLDKATARTNLEVYSKAETDSFLSVKTDTSDFDSFVDAYNTQKFLESKGAYKGSLNTEKSFSGSFTYMFTYIKGSIGAKVSTTLEIFTPMYCEAGDRLSINTLLKKVSINSEMNYDTYEYIDHYDYDFSTDLYSGDKISVVYDSKTFNLKIYVNKILASDINIGRAWSSSMYNLPCGEYFIDAAMFKSALVLADDSAYSIVKFVNGTAILSFCYNNYEDTPEYKFPSGFTGVSGSLYESGVSFAGEDNCLKIYPTTDTKFQTASILDIFNGKFVNGVFKKITMKVYYPTTNVKSKVVKLVSGRDFAVYPKDEWQIVEFYKNSGYANSAYQYVSFRNEDVTNFAGSGTGNDDVFYIASVSAEFDRLAILDISNLKDTDYAVINKAYNSQNKEFKKLFPISATSFVPRIIGDKPIVLTLNPNETLSEILDEYSGIQIGKIEVLSSSAIQTATSLMIGTKTLKIPSLTGSWQFLSLDSPIVFRGDNTIYCTPNISANLTLRLYVWK